MPDELDYVQDRIETEMQMRIDAERQKQVQAPKGVCLYCGELCAEDASFCDEDCASDYREEQSIKQFQSTGRRG